MQNKYLEEITTLLKQVHPKLFTIHQLKFKNVFGAVAGYANGKIFITCGKFGVALKLPEKTLAELFGEKDVKHLKYFPKGHVKKEYAVLPKRMLKNKSQFQKLIDISILDKTPNYLLQLVVGLTE